MTTPAPLTGACVWHGRDMAQSRRWIRELAPDAIAEIDAAVRAVRRRNLAWPAIARADFPLPRSQRLLADIRDELENGSGMVQLRGLPVARYSEDELSCLWFGLGQNLGTPVYQNCRGELMRAIRDEGAEVGARYGQVAGAGKDGGAFLSSYARTLSNGALRFHTDRCDVVGLLCVRQAQSGGVSTLASSPAVHNAMLERRPDLAAALYRPVWRSRLGEEAGGENEAYPLPVFDYRRDSEGSAHFTSHYSLTYIEAAQLRPEVPRLSPEQREAIDELMKLAAELSFEMRFSPGDIQLLNNHVVYHGRTPFEDDAATGQDRLLLRLWLAMPNSRALPHGHEVLWRTTEAGAVRGGIGQLSTTTQKTK
jgi:hypothetical protein